MKTYWIKRLRKNVLKKYEVRKSDAVNAGDRPWCIYTSPTISLAYYEYATKEEAIEALKTFWWKEAEIFLWEHKNRRKKNKYPW